jgi:hypothetical protein
VFAPALGLAQDNSSTGSTEDGSLHSCGLGDQLAAAANAIGIQEAELRASLREGQTIAEVDAANGVKVGAVVDAMVSEAGDALDQAVEDHRYRGG